MLTLRLLWYIRVLEVRARLSRPKMQYYLMAHANGLRDVVLGHTENMTRRDAFRSLFELTITFITEPEFMNSRVVNHMYQILETYLTIKYEERES